MSLSHRDWRMHHRVMRGLAWVTGTAAGFTVLAVALPGSLGLLCVAALAVNGGAYLVWSARVLSEYTSDLRAASDESTPRGLPRAEAAATVAVERTVGLPSGRCPNTRARSRLESRAEASDLEAGQSEGSLSRRR